VLDLIFVIVFLLISRFFSFILEPTLFCAIIIFLLGGESFRLAIFRLRPMFIELKSTLSSIFINLVFLSVGYASNLDLCDTLLMLNNVLLMFCSVYCLYLFKFLLKSHFIKSSKELSSLDSSTYLLGLIIDISFSENGSLSLLPNDLYTLCLFPLFVVELLFELELDVLSSTSEEFLELVPEEDLAGFTGLALLILI
jgi:hypothetical protein